MDRQVLDAMQTLAERFEAAACESPPDAAAAQFRDWGARVASDAWRLLECPDLHMAYMPWFHDTSLFVMRVDYGAAGGSCAVLSPAMAVFVRDEANVGEVLGWGRMIARVLALRPGVCYAADPLAGAFADLRLEGRGGEEPYRGAEVRKPRSERTARR